MDVIGYENLSSFFLISGTCHLEETDNLRLRPVEPGSNGVQG